MLATVPGYQTVGGTISIVSLSSEYLRSQIAHFEPTSLNWTITQSTFQTPLNQQTPVIETAYEAALPNNATVRVPFTFFPAGDEIRIFDQKFLLSNYTIKLGLEIQNWQYPKSRDGNAWVGATLRFSWTEPISFDESVRTFAEKLESGSGIAETKIYFPAANTSFVLRLPTLGQTDHEVSLQPRIRLADPITFFAQAVSGTLREFDIIFLFRLDRVVEYDPDIYVLFDAVEDKSGPTTPGTSSTVSSDVMAIAVGVSVPVVAIAVIAAIGVFLVIQRRRNQSEQRRLNSANQKMTTDDHTRASPSTREPSAIDSKWQQGRPTSHS
jgi:hypothetical protein